MDLKSFASAVNQLSQEKGLPAEKIIESIETALAAAYKKEYGEKSQVIKAKLDPKTGHADFWQVKTVMDDSMIFSEEELEEMKAASADLSSDVPAGASAKEGASAKTRREVAEAKPATAAEGAGEPTEKVKFNPEKHVMLEEAKKDNPGANVGDEIKIELEEKQDFGRIAAQTAKQVIIQKIREAEKETIFADFKLKEGEIISGLVQRIEGRTAFMDIGKTTGVLNREEQVPGEFYRPGQRLKAFVLKVEQTSKGPIIFLSRAYPKFVSKLFELEVPEVGAGQVLIKSIAREAGSRTKIAVFSTMEGIDPIGAAVGQRGTRVSAVINELGGEKIDIIEYSDDSAKYIANALSPAKIMEVKVLPKNKALAVVPSDQLSLAIGKDGQNVRLAAKLTGWKIDVRSPENLAEALAQAEEDAKKESENVAAEIKETVAADTAKSEAEDGKKAVAEKPVKKAKKTVKTAKTKKASAKKKKEEE
jgi:N utilization substance protein A